MNAPFPLIQGCTNTACRVKTAAPPVYFTVSERQCWFRTMDSDPWQLWILRCELTSLQTTGIPQPLHLSTLSLCSGEREAQLCLYSTTLKRLLHVAFQHTAIVLIIKSNMPLIQAPEWALFSFRQTRLLNEGTWGVNSLMDTEKY